MNAGLDTPIESGLALGQPLEAQGLLEVMYGDTTVQTGEPYAADAVANRPTRTHAAESRHVGSAC